MASVLRFGASKLLARNSLAVLCKPTSGTNGAVIQAAFISGKALRVTDNTRPPPYPYETKRFTLFDAIFENTTHRFDENSKIIVVEGPIASGKTKFAKALAEDLDMIYLPAVTMDAEYVNEYGYDCRQLDPILPEACKSYDVKNFCENPHHENCANYQILMYKHRFSQYVDALAHLFSTGQGIIMERCVYSDHIFLETMYNAGYISKAARQTYYDIRTATQGELLLPHLCIYLDVPAAAVKDKIQKRGIPYEVNSKVFTMNYLSSIEHMYKQQYLKELSQYANILVYDWTDEGDVEVVIEDIERLSFDRTSKDDMKFRDWEFWNESHVNQTRREYADNKLRLLTLFDIADCDAPELHYNGEDHQKLLEAWQNAPGNKYMKGYNADQGDTGLRWKFCPDWRDYRSKDFD
ncbi:NADH dehydrogenase [ubiquinone] 1 alpha subcomplex subunit 10, mitochondrial [Athalia rosae]|uniref:NADH dehydrogenase [ubiquinone] 1 alpha subcomplex subunit 10, mitochondrial n=1 Tax=Athalia rosae TaxID=37344 RepID=UPI002033EA86|nr:NADH dehydrogenase [ubiquinone] 1 alpha subcomplex subunit 10, mitochondrial [Athalia rosae]